VPEVATSWEAAAAPLRAHRAMDCPRERVDHAGGSIGLGHHWIDASPERSRRARQSVDRNGAPGRPEDGSCALAARPRSRPVASRKIKFLAIFAF
jgi:hypothetical protein